MFNKIKNYFKNRRFQDAQLFSPQYKKLDQPILLSKSALDQLMIESAKHFPRDWQDIKLDLELLNQIQKADATTELYWLHSIISPETYPSIQNLIKSNQARSSANQLKHC